jgi:hypothetical protein
MITYKIIKLAINTLLLNKFKIEINSNDVKEGFGRPSFFVSFDDMIRSSTPDQVEKSMTIRIYYFPRNREDNSLELLDVQEQLENLFDLKLIVLDRKLNVLEASSVVTDGVLEFSFELHFFEGKEVSPNLGYVDEDGNPLVDENGNPIKTEQMKTLILNERVN